MTLPDFLGFISNLNNETKLYLKYHDQLFPLSKLTISANECLCIAGKHSMTKQKVAQLVKNMHQRRVKLWMVINNQKLPTYGLQISIEHGQAALM